VVGDLRGVHGRDSQAMPPLSPSRQCMSPLALIIRVVGAYP
jgi:hypothetical protein